MELYCETTKEFLQLADSNFSIECESQMQDLENYTCANSYDIELVLNETNAIIINKGYHVQLLNNGVKIMNGVLINNGGTPTTIKAVYKALPYGGCFQDFVMRENLRDYFFGNNGDTESLLTCENLFSPTDDYQHSFNITGVDTKKNVPVYMLNYGTHLKYTYPCFFNINVKTDGLPACFPVLACDSLFPLIPILKEQYTSLCQRGFAYIPMDKMLNAMGIKVADNNEQSGMIIPLFNKVHYMLKVYMECVYYSDESARTRFRYYSTARTNIQLQDNDTGDWDENLPTYDLGTSYFRKSLREIVGNNGFVSHSPNAPFDMTCKRIDWYYAKEKTEMFTDNIRKQETYDGETYWHFRQDLKDELKFEKGNDFYLQDSTDVNIKVYGNGKRFAVAYFDCEMDLDYAKYRNNMELFSDVPLLWTQFNFMKSTTNDFINQLSLNTETYSSLRNPMFINQWNKKVVHNMIGSLYNYATISDSDIISVKKETDTDANRALFVDIDNEKYCGSTYKQLNNLNTDIKKIDQTFTSYMIRTNNNMVLSENGYVPPFYYDQTKATDDESYYASENIYGCFCQVPSSATKDMTTNELEYNMIWCEKYPSVEWSANMVDMQSDTMAYDYVDTYADKSVKYTIETTNYKMQEFVEWNGQKFAVGKFSTSDFIRFELTLYKL